MKDSFGATSELEAGGTSYRIHRVDALADRFPVDSLPYSLKVLLENVLRLEDGVAVTADPAAEPSDEIPFQPARVLMQDFTGVPAVVDLAAMRDAMAAIGGEPSAINPLVDVDLVIDHSVQVDAFGSGMAFQVNAEREFERNRERYEFLKWGQGAFDNFRVVPPATGICHQVNLEYIARVVYSGPVPGDDGVIAAYPDTLVGTDSHTTMVNGLGVRLDLRNLPTGRRDDPVPGVDRPADRAARSGRRLHPRAGHVPRAGFTRAPLLGDAGAGPRFGRAVDRRTEAAPGPDLAERREAGLPRGADRTRRWCGR